MTAERAGRLACASAVAAIAALTTVATSWGRIGAAAMPLGSRAAPTLTATPAADLADGQYVKLTMTNFPKNSSFDFLQCTPSPASAANDCAAFDMHLFAGVNGAGSGSTYMPVYSGGDHLLENGAGTGQITCDQKDPCWLVAVSDSTNISTLVASTVVTFAPTPDSCPPPGANQVLGSGSASAYRAMYAWESTVCQPPQSLAVGYTLGNSVSGVNNFFNGVSNFGVTGPWAPSYTPASHATPPQTWDYAPITMSGVVLAFRAYSIVRGAQGPQITNLVLTPATVASIYTGQETTDWNLDPAITSLNPGIQFPVRMIPYVRADQSAEDWVLTSWLSAAAPTVWTKGPQEIFPSTFGVQSLTGSAAVGSAVISEGTDYTTQGQIGFMDSSTAAYYGLPTVQIKNADGTITAATPQTIAQAISDATSNGDGTITPDYATKDTSAWPMLMPTYMMVPTNKVTPAVGSVIASFLRYAVQQGQTSLPAGYVPLTADMVKTSLAAANAIPVTVPSPSPSASPTPAPLGGSGSGSGGGLGTGGGGGTSLGGGTTTPSTPTPHPTATVRPTAAPAHAVKVSESQPGLALTGSDSSFALPAVGIVAAGALLGGLLLEVLGRRRRRLVP